jgi:glycosidase
VLKWAEAEANPAVLAFYRVMPEETILAIHNLSQDEQAITIADAPGSRFESLFTSQKVLVTNSSLKLVLKQYDYLWLKTA